MATESQMDAMNARANGRQRCTKCKRRSLPGLSKGNGACAYHFAEAVWGPEWADHAAQLETSP